MSKSIIILFVIALFIWQIMIVNADNNTYINTTNIIFDEEKIRWIAEGSTINFNNTNILVDRGIIDYDNDKIEVFGNFYLYQDLNILSGKDSWW